MDISDSNKSFFMIFKCMTTGQIITVLEPTGYIYKNSETIIIFKCQYLHYIRSYFLGNFLYLRWKKTDIKNIRWDRKK